MISPTTDRSRQRLVLAVAMLSGACYLFSTVALAPVLVQVAREFGITIGTAGLATAVYTVPSIIIALVAGPFSDRYGRERFLVSGALILALGSVVAALAPSFALVVAGRAVAGVGGGLMGANMVGIGFVLGGQAGGRLGDRIGHARLLPLAIMIGAATMIAMTDLSLGLIAAAGSNLVLAVSAGARTITQQSLISEQIPRARATLLSINTSLNAASVAIGVTLGGTIIDLAGFPVLGAVFAGLLLSSAALMLTFARHTTALVDAAA